uniref:START domain-containing protein n=1 Tax=Romanomermis culicivorax TaxID=13658 RepID=A0A915L4V1_ROMCU
MIAYMRHNQRFENETKAIYDEFSRLLLLDEKEWTFEKEEAGCKISSIMTENSTKSRCFKCEYGSIKYDKETPKGIGLRGWMHPSGFAAFKTDDPNVTNAVVIWHSEFQALPGFLVKSVVEKASIAGMIQYIENLRTMKDKPYEPLTKDVAMCRNR